MGQELVEYGEQIKFGSSLNLDLNSPISTLISITMSSKNYVSTFSEDLVDKETNIDLQNDMNKGGGGLS